MSSETLLRRLRELACEPVPLPGCGATAERHRRLFEIGREDLSLARLAEAHFDAVAILAEAGREPESGILYGVWAAEIPGQSIRLSELNGRLSITGRKMFASGATLLDRALVTVEAPEPWLVDVDLRSHKENVQVDISAWKTAAFSSTRTASVVFNQTSIGADAIVGQRGWYLSRPGFWHGAMGPAACWAGGAAGLVDYARAQPRSDPHTLAHLGAMGAAEWALKSFLKTAGDEIDQALYDASEAHQRALKCRHLIEQMCTDILQRFGRAYGPHPLTFDAEISARHQELTVYLRQCHAERDLAALGKEMFSKSTLK